MVALPGEHNLHARQGQAFYRSIVYTDDNNDPVDLTGYSAYMPIRRGQKNNGPLLFQLDIDNSGIVLGGSSGTVELYVSATMLGQQPSGSHYYDLVLVPGGDMEQKFALLTGDFKIDSRVKPEES